MHLRTSFAYASVSALALTMLAQPVMAQDADASASENDTIIVTTRKREESLFEVPIAITAFTAEDLYEAGIESTDDLARNTTGFTMAPLFGNAATPVIRGLSTTIGEPNVGFFVDGVYQSSRLAMEALIGSGVAQIEIAKGPQSALYGRNTFAGAVNYVTAKPANSAGVYAQGTFGTDNLYDLRGGVSGAIVEDKLYVRVGGLARGRDGYYTNALTGNSLDSQQSVALSGSVQFFATPNFETSVTVSYEDTSNGDFPLAYATNNATFFPAFGLPPNNQIFAGELPAPTSFAVTPGGFDRENLQLSMQSSLDFGSGYTLTSIFGYNDLSTLTRVDNDYEARQIAYTTTSVDQGEISQEFRITSPGDQRFQWSLGAYYYHQYSKTHANDQRLGTIAGILPFLPGSLVGLVGGGENFNKETTTSKAVFGDITFDVTDKLKLNFAGRFTDETKAVVSDSLSATGGLLGQYVNSVDFENFQPKATISYFPTDNWMLYGSVADAEKTGGFNVVTVAGSILPSERTYDPETARHWEVGAKGSLLDGNLQVTAALFQIDWEDQIVRAIGGTGAILNINAGATTSKGFEFDFAAKLSENLELEGGFAYTDSAYDSYTFGVLGAIGLNPVLDGTRLQFVSEFAGNLSATYTRSINADMDWFGRVGFAWQSDQSAVQPATTTIGSQSRLDIRSGFTWDNYELTFWAKNVLEDDAALNGVYVPNPAERVDTVLGFVGAGPFTGFTAFSPIVLAPEPRTAGVTLRAKF
ncbi:MAG: hypothetical protein COA47_16195 [Robiginitomaculum sp.]|nr:MAG: hypothetical protein COA47_16195 [Robiginitomaculum sp.]